MKPYSVLAKHYDRFSQSDCDYDRWSQYLEKIAKSVGAEFLADIACGTGKMTKLLCEKGFRVLGVDESAEMLNEAVSKCPRATFAQQNMKNLRLPHPADMAVSVNDGVNYLKPTDLLPFFQKVAQNLKCGAPFVFDISSSRKLREVVGDNVFFVDENDATLLWSNTVADDKVEMSLALFERRGDVYVRFDEKHTQYIHTRQNVEDALQNAGFSLCEVTADYGRQLLPDSLRITFFTCKK